MRTLRRNKQLILYRNYLGKQPIHDTNGYETGEYTIAYDEPRVLYANVSAVTGNSQVEQFGTNLNYDKVIVTSDLSLSVNEETVLILDPDLSDFLVTDGGLPLFTDDGRLLSEVDISTLPLDYNYIVKKVAKSLNSISYAISRVSTQ